MAYTRAEKHIEDTVCDYAQSRGWLARKMQFVGRRGCPDRWFFRAGQQLQIIEFKDPNGRLSLAQKKHINRLKEFGFRVNVIDSVAEGKEVFDSWDEPSN